MAEKTAKKTTKASPAKAAPKAAAPAAATATEAKKTLHRRTLTGVVVSDKMMKTRVVRIERQIRNGMYGKYTTKANKFKFHDENNTSKVGDLVSIIESRPLSREKRWALQKIIRSATGAVLKG